MIGKRETERVTRREDEGGEYCEVEEEEEGEGGVYLSIPSSSLSNQHSRFASESFLLFYFIIYHHIAFSR